MWSFFRTLTLLPMLALTLAATDAIAARSQRWSLTPEAAFVGGSASIAPAERRGLHLRRRRAAAPPMPQLCRSGAGRTAVAPPPPTTIVAANESGDGDGDPPPSMSWSVTVEYCTGCRWMLRASYLACELLTTFRNDGGFGGVALVPRGPPSWPGGVFRVSAFPTSEDASNNDAGAPIGRIVLWDRSVEGRFPESKEIKRIVRDLVDPDKDLGHSDIAEIVGGGGGRDEAKGGGRAAEAECVECRPDDSGGGGGMSESFHQSAIESTSSVNETEDEGPRNVVTVEYSSSDHLRNENWLYRANWYAQELLSMKDEIAAPGDDVVCEEEGAETVEVKCVTLIPNRSEEGLFRICLNDDDVIYDRQSESSPFSSVYAFADASEIKHRVRKALAGKTTNDDGGDAVLNGWEDEMDEDEAEEVRRYFGVG